MDKLFAMRDAGVRYHKKNRARVELFYSIITVLILTVLSFSFEIELVESVYDFTRDHEDWELDELIFSFLWVAIVAVIYASRRVSEIVKINKINAYNANHDSLTGLPSRAYSQYLMSKMLDEASSENSNVAVIFMDLNDFKNINDSFGHDHGDLLLKQIGSRLKSVIRDGEVVSRLGGDEFLVFAQIGKQIDSLEQLVERIQNCTKDPFKIYAKSICSSFSIGVAKSPEHGESVNSLLAAADAAMYEAKRNKDMPVFYYSNYIGQRNKENYELSSNLRTAIMNKDLYLVFQPIVNSYSGQIEGYEALTRWEFEGDLVNAEIIISMAESIGLSEHFFIWLIETALAESTSFLKPAQFISINVTAKQFLSEQFLAIIIDARSQYKNKIISLEITESSILADYEKTVETICQLRQLGIKVMIDDFGTGYSSLGRLKDLDIDKIKIDKSFLVDTENNDKSRKIFASIFGLATTLEIEVVAEGLETVEQLELLRLFPPMLVQGFLLQEPTVKELLKSESSIHNIMNNHKLAFNKRYGQH